MSLSCRPITERFVQGLIRHWQGGTRQWIILYDKFIRKEIDMELRLQCKIATFELLTLVRDAWVLLWSRYICTLRQGNYARLRLLEIIPEFHSWRSDPNVYRQREPAAFNSAVLISHKMDSKIIWFMYSGYPDTILRV